MAEADTLVSGGERPYRLTASWTVSRPLATSGSMPFAASESAAPWYLSYEDDLVLSAAADGFCLGQPITAPTILEGNVPIVELELPKHPRGVRKARFAVDTGGGALIATSVSSFLSAALCAWISVREPEFGPPVEFGVPILSEAFASHCRNREEPFHEADYARAGREHCRDTLIG
jgi:hypothetical protein